MSEAKPSDLVVLAADKNMEFTVRGLLTRHHSLGVRQPVADIFSVPGRDPATLRECHEFLRAFLKSHRHALVMFDREGCGRENHSREQLEQEVESRLRQSGWRDRAAAVVLDPELEIWVWSDSPHVDTILGWTARKQDLRSWLIGEQLLEAGQVKPARPKEALEKALRQARKPRSSSLYLELAQRVSLTRCTDGAFRKFVQTMQRWFGQQPQ